MHAQPAAGSPAWNRGRRVQAECGARAGDGDVGLAIGEATVQVDVQVVDGRALRLVHGECPCEREWHLPRGWVGCGVWGVGCGVGLGVWGVG